MIGKPILEYEKLIKTYERLIKHFGGHCKAAREIGVSQATVSGWSKGSHGMSAEIAFKVELITGGKFKAVDLCKRLKKAVKEIEDAA